MSELKIHLSASLSEKFRRIAMSVYGYGRGSLSKAAEDAFSRWCEQHEQNTVKDKLESSKRSTSVPETEASHDPEERHIDQSKPGVEKPPT